MRVITPGTVETSKCKQLFIIYLFIHSLKYVYNAAEITKDTESNRKL